MKTWEGLEEIVLRIENSNARGNIPCEKVQSLYKTYTFLP